MGSKRGILSHVGVPKDRERFVCRMCIGVLCLSTVQGDRGMYTLSVIQSQQRPRLADLTWNRRGLQSHPKSGRGARPLHRPWGSVIRPGCSGKQAGCGQDDSPSRGNAQKCQRLRDLSPQQP